MASAGKATRKKAEPVKDGPSAYEDSESPPPKRRGGAAGASTPKAALATAAVPAKPPLHVPSQASARALRSAKEY